MTATLTKETKTAKTKRKPSARRQTLLEMLEAAGSEVTLLNNGSNGDGTGLALKGLRHWEEDGDSLTLNGSFYNMGDVRPLLRKQECATKLSGRSDESELRYVDWSGEDSDEWLSDAAGMYAFVLSRPDRVVIARDPLGTKPLYIGRQDDRIVAGFDIKSVADVSDDVAEFPPGHLFVSGYGLRRYFRLPDGSPEFTHARSASHAIGSRLVRTVRASLPDNGAVGVLLSGGLSSTLIAAIARRFKTDLHTFTVGTEKSRDIHYARLAAKDLGTKHHERVFTIDEAREALPEIIAHLESFDRDTVRSAIPAWFAAKLAAEHVPIALSGVGADALFGGYVNPPSASDTLKKVEKNLRARTSQLHRRSLQRADRMSQAHGLEARLPFVDDPEFIRFALSIAPKLKVGGQGEGRRGKWALRKAAQELLSPMFVLRKRMPLASGSGLGKALARYADETISDKEFERESEIADGVTLGSKEELLYFRHFRDAFPVDKALPLVRPQAAAAARRKVTSRKK